MKKLMVVTTGERKIEYETILGFFSYEIYPLENIGGNEEGDALLIDSKSKEESIKVGNLFRKNNPNVPILIMTDHNNPLVTEDVLSLKGVGQLRTYTRKNNDAQKLTEILGTLLDPSYANETFNLSVVVPLYNEGERFEHVLNFASKLNMFLEKNYNNSKVYFINDGSMDNTKKLTDELISRFQEESNYISDFGFLELKDLTKNTKKAGTYIEGLKNIEGDIVIIVDGDDSFFIEDIAKMVNILRQGYYEVVAGTKDATAEKRPLIRKGISFFKRVITKPLLPKGVYDPQTGLKGMKGEVAKYLLPYLSVSRELAIDLEMMYICKKLNFRTKQLPVKCIDRDGSHVNIVKDSIKYIVNLVDIIKTTKVIKI